MPVGWNVHWEGLTLCWLNHSGLQRFIYQTQLGSIRYSTASLDGYRDTEINKVHEKEEIWRQPKFPKDVNSALFFFLKIFSLCHSNPLIPSLQMLRRWETDCRQRSEVRDDLLGVTGTRLVMKRTGQKNDIDSFYLLTHSLRLSLNH